MWKGVVVLVLFVATAAARPTVGGVEVRVSAAGGVGAAGAAVASSAVPLRAASTMLHVVARAAPRRALLQQQPLPGPTRIVAPAESPPQPQPAPQLGQPQQRVTAQINPGDKAATDFAAAVLNQTVTEITVAPGVQLTMRPALFRGYGAGRPLGLFPIARDLTVRSADPGRMTVIDWAMTDAILLLPEGRVLTFSGMVIENIRYGPGAGVDFVRGTGPASRLRFVDCLWLRQVCLPPENNAGIGLVALVRASNPGAPPAGSAAAPLALLPFYRFNGTEYTTNVVYARNASLIVVPGAGSDDIGHPDAGSSDTRFSWTLVNTTRLCEVTVDPQCLETNSANACYDAAFSALRAGKSPAQAAAATGTGPPAAAVAAPVVVGTAALAGAAAWLLLARKRRRARRRAAAAANNEGGPSKHMTLPGYAQAWATLGEMRGGGMPGEGWKMVTRSSAPQFAGGLPSATPPGSDQSHPLLPRPQAPGEHVQLGVLIGAGSFGRVYRGRWRGREVAVKVMLHDASVAATVAREIDLVISFKHDNIVQAHHFIVWHKDHSSGSNTLNTDSDRFSDAGAFQPSASDVYTLTSCGGSHAVTFSDGTASGAAAGAAAAADGRGGGGGGASGAPAPAPAGAAPPAADAAAAGGPPAFSVVPFTRGWGFSTDGAGAAGDLTSTAAAPSGAAAAAAAVAAAAAASGEAPSAAEALAPGGSPEQRGGLLAAAETPPEDAGGGSADGRRGGDSAANSSLIQRFRAAAQQAASLLNGGTSLDATSSAAAATATASTASASRSVPSAEQTGALGVAAGGSALAAGGLVGRLAVGEASSGGGGEGAAEAAAGMPPGVASLAGTSGPVGGGIVPVPPRAPATRRTAARRSGARGEFGSGSGGILKGEAQTWLVLEYCDKGNLADAVREGLLHSETEDEESPNDTSSDASGDTGDAGGPGLSDQQQANGADTGSAPREDASGGGGGGGRGGVAGGTGGSGGGDDAAAADQRGGGGGRGRRRGEGGGPRLASLDLPHALHLLVDVARGMAYLHARNVVHADLKCQNVLLTTAPGRPWGEAAKISDFGLSKALALDQTHVTTHSMGTVTHMPPEMFKTGRMSPAGDVYAFGVLVWEVLTGRGAFHGLHYAEVIEQVAIRGVRPPIPPAVPPELSALMEACWQADPTKRPGFDTLVACLEALLQACTGAGSSQGSLDTAKSLLTPKSSLPGCRGTTSSLGTGSRGTASGGGTAAASGSASSGPRAATAAVGGAAVGAGGGGASSNSASSSTSAAVAADASRAPAGPPPPLLLGPNCSARQAAQPQPAPCGPLGETRPQPRGGQPFTAAGTAAAPPPPPPLLAPPPPPLLAHLPLRHTLHVVVPGALGPPSRSNVSHGLTPTTGMVAGGFATAADGAAAGGPQGSPALGRSTPSGAASGGGAPSSGAARPRGAAGKGAAAATSAEASSSRRASQLLEPNSYFEDL